MGKEEAARHTKKTGKVFRTISVNRAYVLAVGRVPQLIHVVVLHTLEAVAELC